MPLVLRAVPSWRRAGQPGSAGRWLGEVYAESDARLNFRKDVLDFLQLLAREDQQFVDTIDRMLKYLWRKNADGEDIAYLLGRIIHAQPIKDELLRQDDVIPQFWPIVGDQLRIEVEDPKPYVCGRGGTGADDDARRAAGAVGILHRAHGRVVGGSSRTGAMKCGRHSLAGRLRSRSSSRCGRPRGTGVMADFRRIFAELGATFDVWFFESEVEEEGKQIVEDLLERGIAEISEGLPVVKIDEKLGLDRADLSHHAGPAL